MSSLLFGHLLIGPLLLILGFIIKRFPPKKINAIYGYRTPRSMRSQEAWDCANVFSTNALLIVSASTCLMQVIFYALIGGKDSVMWSAGFLVTGVILIIPLTEIHLKRKGF